MKVFVVVLSAFAIASALDVDWATIRPRNIDPRILSLVPSNTPTDRITGGEEAVPNSIPYQVALFLSATDGTYFCGASLIHPEWILTAAHCVDGVNSVQALFGAHNVRETEESTRVERIVPQSNIIKHEQYNPSTISNDIALIRIPAVTLNENIQTINLPRASEVNKSFEGADTIASGWGKPSDSATGISPVLRFIKVKIMNLFLCKLQMMFLPTDNNICINGANKQSTCNGDSGGPLAALENNDSRTLIGLTSFGLSSGCEKGNPAAFTRCTSYLDWIVSKTGIVLRP